MNPTLSRYDQIQAAVAQWRKTRDAVKSKLAELPVVMQRVMIAPDCELTMGDVRCPKCGVDCRGYEQNIPDKLILAVKRHGQAFHQAHVAARTGLPTFR